MKKRIFCIFVGVMLLLTQISFAQEAVEPTQDENGYYLLDSAEDLFWFADFVAETAENDAKTATENGTAITRTLVKGKLTANIDLNPGLSVSYNEETGEVTLAKGEKSYTMETGLKGTTIGKFTDSDGNTFSSDDVEKALEIKKWTPIGTNNFPFVGYFDGNGHTVDGLYINEHTPRGDDSELRNDVGFFGNTNTNTTTGDYQLPNNYTIKNFSIGQHSLVVGYDEKSENNTALYQSVGAIAGNTNRDGIYKCENNAIVVGMGCYYFNYAHTGGLVGTAGGAVNECINKGTVISPNVAGGIVGWKWTYSQTNYSYEADSKIYKCINYGKVLADTNNADSKAGGITAGAGYSSSNKYINGGYIEGCCNKGDVSGYKSAGIVAFATYYTYIYRCSNFGNISAPYIAGGIVGLMDYYLAGAKICLCYNAGKIHEIRCFRRYRYIHISVGRLFLLSDRHLYFGFVFLQRQRYLSRYRQRSCSDKCNGNR